MAEAHEPARAHVTDRDESGVPTSDAVREELARVLQSPAFASAVRSRRFLTYIVEQTLANQSDGIKELVLGREVFDRPSDFDPRIDPIVRIEAGKLRKRLDDYYAGNGHASGIVIEVPKGGYVPRFVTRTMLSGSGSVDLPGAAVSPPPTARRARTLLLAASALILTAAFVWLAGARGSSTSTTEASIAVLPFQNLSPDPQNAYLADGLSEDLTDALARLDSLRVVARTSASAYKDARADVREIGARLDASYLIEGSVRREGERLRVTVQLVRTDDGYHVWSRSFDRTMNDVLEVQREIAGIVVASVANATSAHTAAKPHVPTPQAFDLYLQGVHAAGSDLDRAERLLRAAVAADPKYARPHVALAGVNIRADIFGVRPTPVLIANARAEVEAALSLDERSAEARAIYGSLLARHEYDWEAAEQELRRALVLDPNSSMAHNELAQNVLAPQERWDEAFAETQRALELDPLSPAVAAGRAFLFYLKRQPATSVDAFRQAMADRPEPLQMSGLAIALIADRKEREAIALLDAAGAAGQMPLMVTFRGLGLARMGRKDEARATLRRLEEEGRSRFISAGSSAMIQAALGDVDDALQSLEKSRQEKSSGLIFLRTGDVFDSLRGDPRFHRLLEEVGLSDADLARRARLR